MVLFSQSFFTAPFIYIFIPSIVKSSDKFHVESILTFDITKILSKATYQAVDMAWSAPDL